MGRAAPPADRGPARRDTARSAASGFERQSRTTSSSGTPSTPPVRLISSIASRAARTLRSPICAPVPVIRKRQPDPVAGQLGQVGHHVARERPVRVECGRLGQRCSTPRQHEHSQAQPVRSRRHQAPGLYVGLTAVGLARYRYGASTEPYTGGWVRGTIVSCVLTIAMRQCYALRSRLNIRECAGLRPTDRVIAL